MAKIPVHQWTNDSGEVLVLRFSKKNGSSYGGFQHPMAIGKKVSVPDWRKDTNCGGGIHGWAWGIGIGDGKQPEWSEGLWQVYGVKPSNIVGNIESGIKCKFKTGILRFLGNWHEALMFILDGQRAWVEHFADGEGHATSDRSAASSTGNRSAASSTGSRSAALSTGDSSAASATGKASAAVVTGLNGRAMVGEYGCMALVYYNNDESRFEMRCAETGCGDGSDGKLKANVWYRLDANGNFIEV